jgi:hypothetical protein
MVTLLFTVTSSGQKHKRISHIVPRIPPSAPQQQNLLLLLLDAIEFTLGSSSLTLVQIKQE